VRLDRNQERRIGAYSHPESGVPTRTFRYPGEVDVVGRVTGVAMRITGEEFAPIDARARQSSWKK